MQLNSFRVFLIALPFFAFSDNPVPGKRAHHALVYDEGNNQIIMTCGSTPVNDNSAIFLNDTWSFDGKQWKTFNLTSDLRSGMTLAYHSKKKKIFSFGGFSDAGSLGELRVLEGDSWKVISSFDEMKAAEAGFVYDEARDKLIMFGGSAARGQTNATTWEWDGISWKKFDGKGPQGRQAFAMIYDSKRKKTVLYGGTGGGRDPFTDGVWEFDGTKWENIPLNGANPGSRLSPGYAFDSKRGMLVIFGGISDRKMNNETWGWDGKQWKKLADTGPSARAMGHMAYDKKRDRIVLFGGRISWPNDANDTWEWDGTKWKEIKF